MKRRIRNLDAARKALEAKRTRLGAALRIGEAGRVLSAANEAKLRDALDAIQTVLDSVGQDDAAQESARARLAEAWSSAAWDACDGAYLLAGVISLMGTESDEPDQLAMLQRAYDGLSEWIAAEVGEIAQPDADDMDMGLLDLGLEGERVAPSAGATVVREALTGEVQALRERAVADDGTAQIKLIQPGWGSSGYYSEAVLKRDGATAWPSGTKMYWDHPTAEEEVARPEGSLRDLAAELVTDPVYETAGAEGPGLYAQAKVFGPYREAVDELAPHIGVSVRGWAKTSTGTAEGRTGRIVDQLIEGTSVDFVTLPGAGGQVLQLFEAARRRPAKEVNDVDQKQLDEAVARATAAAEQRAAAAEQRAARAEEALLRRTAGEKIAARLDEAKVPEAAQRRLAAALSANPPLTAEGALDEAALATRVDEAVKAEAEYLASLGVGTVRGFGGEAPTDRGKETTQALEGAFARMGLSETAARTAAAGRK
jgi:hypothetical protein